MDKDRKDGEPPEDQDPKRREDPKQPHFDFEQTQRMLESAFADDKAMSEVQLAIVRRVLGNLELFCPDCGGFCHGQEVALRDRFMQRGLELAQQMVRLFDLYFRTREVGIAEPYEVINRLYTRWAEIGFVYDMAEPQERVPDPTLIAFEIEGLDGIDPFADGEDEGE